MALGWRDGVATVLTGGAALIAYAKVKGWDWPLLGSWRIATLILLVLGLGTCIIVGSGGVPAKDGWNIAASVLGGLAFVIGIAGLIFNNQALFVVLAVDIIALWAVATLHHIIAAGG